jgi:hydroxylamine dehydrogenase
MRYLILLTAVLFAPAYLTYAAVSPISQATQTCLECHRTATPGIVADWEKSLHARITPVEAAKKAKLNQRVSATSFPDAVSGVVVGCAECHTLTPVNHKDSFSHNGFQVHPVVTPANCAVCHPKELDQYSRNIMSHAYGNLMDNKLYGDMINHGIGTPKYAHGKLTVKEANSETAADACLSCHGTQVKVNGLKTRKTMLGDMEFPVLSGWPNQGVGRINPDNSKGACTSCHPRHSFSIEVARKPATCSQCHKGPDVPAYKVFEVSKHGNIYSSLKNKWNWDNVPWVIGKDFTAPSCATCHASLITSPEGEVIAERTHQFNDRTAWRLFGLPYAHAHPKSPDTTIIRNKAGLPLPTELTGEPVAEFLITPQEQRIRTERMQQICQGCHSQQWVNGHYVRMENSIAETNAKTLTATEILLDAWNSGLAAGPMHGGSVFDESIEKEWVQQWLFYGNSTRFASAMGGADYGVFANGRWYMNKNIADMKDRIDFLKATAELKKQTKKK